MPRRFRDLVHCDLFTRQCAEILPDARRLDEALRWITNQIASFPERGRRLGESPIWTALSRATTPAVLIYYQFNDDYVYLLAIRRRQGV